MVPWRACPPRFYIFIFTNINLNLHIYMENLNYKFIRCFDLATAAAIGANVAQAGQSIASIFGSKGYTPLSKKAQSAYDLYSNKDRENQKKNLEEITKPYYEWQKLNDARLTIAGLRSAGINPLMAYGGLGQALGADSIPVQSSSPDISSLVSASQGAGRLQLDSVDALSRAALNLANTRKTNAETDKTSEEAQSQRTFNQFAKDIYKGQRDINFANIRLTNAQTVVEGLTGKEKIASIRKLYKECNVLDAQVANINQQTKLFNQQRELLMKQGDLTDKQIEKLESDISLQAAQTARTYFGIQVDRAQIANFQASARLLLEQGTSLGFANQFQSYLQGPLHSNKPKSFRQMEYLERRRSAELAGFNFTIDQADENRFRVGLILGDIQRIKQSQGYYQDNVNGIRDVSRFLGGFKLFMDSVSPQLLKFGSK